MPSGVTRQALRGHYRALAGPAATQLLAATVVAAMLNTRASLSSSLSPELLSRPPLADVMDASAVFLGDSVYLTVVIVGVTTALALGAQLRDFALLRSVGASPAQLRRSVVLQSLTSAVPASLVGVLLGAPTAAAWLTLLRGREVVPAATRFAWSAVSLPTALAAVLVTSVVAAVLAARRTARMKPAVALVEASVGRRPRVATVRAGVGIVLGAGGVVLAAVLDRHAPDQLADAGVFVLIAECIGAGLLAPILLRAGAAIIRRLVPLGVVRVATDDLHSQAHRLGGALVPLVLGGAFTTVKICLHTTSSAAGQPEGAGDRWLDWSGSAIVCAFAAVAAVNCLITLTVSRRRDFATMQLAGASRATVLRVVAVQAGVIVVVAVVSAAAIAFVTLAPMLHATLDRWWPHLPVSVTAAELATMTTLVLVATVGPAVRLTGHAPVRVTAAA